jgi:predicted nucleic acid-binding protein
MDLLRRDAVHTPIMTQVIGIAPTLADDLVLATAVSGEADCLITGDRQFRAINTFRGVKFLTPREFCELLESETSNS